MLIVGLPGASVAAKTTDERISELYESAQTLFGQGDYRGAVIQLKNVLQHDAGDLSARLLMGRAYLKLGDGVSAEKAFQRARQHGVDADSVVVPLGRALLLQRKFKPLLEQIRNGGQRGKHQADILSLRGQAHFALRENESAERDFEEALRQAPDHSDALLGLARLRHSQNEVDAAADFINRALKLAPESPDIWQMKGQILHRQRDFDNSLAHFDKAIELAHDHIQARIGRAATLMSLDRNKDALVDVLFVRKLIPGSAQAAYLNALILTIEEKHAEADEALRDAANRIEGQDRDAYIKHPEMLLLRGVINFALHQTEDAYLNLSRFIDLKPRHTGARKMLGALMLRRNEIEAAIAILEPAIKLAPDDVEILALLGQVHLRNRAYAKAYPLLQKAARLAPKEASLKTGLALTQLAVGDKKIALKSLESVAIDGNQRIGQAAVVFGLVTLRDGDTASVLKIAGELAKKEPDNPFPYNLAGAAYLQNGNIGAARASFERVLAIAPNYLPALMNLASIDLREGKTGAARQRYLRILTHDPKEPRAMIALSQLAEKAGDINEAISRLEQFGKLKIKAISPRLKLYTLYRQANRTKEANRLINELIKKYPRAPTVLLAKARNEASAGKTANAIATLRAAFQRTKKSHETTTRIALQQIELKDFEGAKTTLKSLIAQYPNYLPAHGALVTLEAQSGDTNKALAMATAFRDAHPASAVGDLLVGDILMRKKRYEEAEAAYAAGQAKQRSPEFALRLYRVRVKRGRAETALTILRTWNALHPGNPTVERVIATAYISKGNLKKAIRLHEILLDRRPKDIALLNNLAQLYQRRGDPRAITLAERAHALSPKSPMLMASYGWILVQQGQPERGMRMLRNAEILAAESDSIRYYMAAALSRLGRNDEARRALDQLMKSGRDFAEKAAARALLSRLQEH